jgi:hypothetical protein
VVPAMAAEVLMFLVHLTTTAFMTAIIWFMQIGTPLPNFPIICVMKYN